MSDNGGLLRATGLWKKTVERKGKKVVQLTGTWGGIRVIILPNDRKERDGQPDYFLLLARQQPRDSGEGGEPEGGL